MAKFQYFKSCDVTENIKVKISRLEGERKEADFLEVIDDPCLLYSGLYNQATSSLFVVCELYAAGFPLTGIPIQTSYPSHVSRTTRWGEWLVFPFKYQDLPLESLLVFTVYDVYGPRKAVAVGGTSFPLFSKKKTLQKGKHKLYIWQNKEGDGSKANSTPGIVTDILLESDRLEKLVKNHATNKINALPWLDKHTFQQIKNIKKRYSKYRQNDLFLHIELPLFEYPVVFHEKDYDIPQPYAKELVLVNDPELTFKNPVEMKHMKLARSAHGLLDKDLKPNVLERDLIYKIIHYPPTTQLQFEEKEILWKFRYYLRKDKKALTKFLKCVDWNDKSEASQASELMEQWDPIDIDDSLELLSASFTYPKVREYAVSRLQEAENEQLLSYLLQLVQTLRYESVGDAPLTTFLIERAVSDTQLGNFFHWYLTVECCENARGTHKNFYARTLRQFHNLLATSAPNGHERLRMFMRQKQLVKKFVAMQEIIVKSGTRPKRIEKLRELIGPNGKYQDLGDLDHLTLPLTPEFGMLGVVPETASVFKSQLSPFRITFKTELDSLYTIIFKAGDDLRQDQLVIQLISLMDKLLKKENLDLKLTPYRVLATSFSEGMMECVPSSQSLASVIKDYGGDIQKFLRGKHPQPDGEYGIDPEVLDTYVRSCAGYCVITYILGVGDRHLDNLMLTDAGNLFHVDFGFILGRDPKPFPPPMKLCKEMVEGMGGHYSESYLKFKEHCCEAFNILRKSANLILNLLSLMVDADIPDISQEPEKSILKVQNNFHLHMTDAEANATFQSLINESVSALFPQITEAIHRWAQYWRS